jgi:hypothetical protein
MKDPAQLHASIERFRRRFWERSGAGRPPVAVVPDRSWLPTKYLEPHMPGTSEVPSASEPFAAHAPGNSELPGASRELSLADVASAPARTDYEDAALFRQVFSDDWLPYAAPWRAIPWLEAVCGCGVRYADGHLAPAPWATSMAEVADGAWAPSAAWRELLDRLTGRLVAAAPADCWISPTILRGASDALAAMRGLSNFMLDLVDDPAAVERAAARVNAVLLDLIALHFSRVGPRLAGYGHIFGYWAPGPTIALQEDALGLCRPAIYERIFRPLTAEAVRRLGAYTIFHVHATGFKHYRHVLDVPGLAGVQLTVERNGPPLVALLPAMAEILARTRLILFVDAWFEQLPDVLPRLPQDGLFVMLSDRDVASEEAFQEFVRIIWPE